MKKEKKWIKETKGVTTMRNDKRGLNEDDFITVQSVAEAKRQEMECDIKRLILEKHPEEIKIKIEISYR